MQQLLPHHHHLNPHMQLSDQIPSVGGHSAGGGAANQTQIVFYPVSTHSTNHPRMVNLLNDSYDSLGSANQFLSCGQLETSTT